MFDIIFVFSTSIFIYIEVMIIKEVMAIILVRSFVSVVIVVDIGAHHVFLPCRNIKRKTLTDFCSYCVTAGDSQTKLYSIINTYST